MKNKVFIEMERRGDDFVFRKGKSIVECAGDLKCDNLVIVTNNDKRTIEKDGYKIDVVPVYEF